MHGLFRIATRTLSLGLIAALSLVVVVIAKGIHPEVLVAFKPTDNATLIASDAKNVQPPEHFAQAQSGTRLDVSNGIRSAINGKTRPSISARRSPPDLSENTSAAQQLPPLPVMPEESLEAPANNQVEPVFELPAPSGSETAQPTEVAQAVPPPSPAESPATTDAATAPGLENSKPAADSNFVAQLTALQEQLNKIAAQQEQSHQSQQSWLESHQLLHQRQLEQKMEGIEAGLKELKAQLKQAGTPVNNSVDRGTSRSTIIRHDKAGSPSSPLTSGASSVVRDVLGSLAEQSNVNLTLSINVEGDVEMNLQDRTAESAGSGPQPSPGYVVQKNGQQIYIPPAEPQGTQREVFLPPIIKSPPR